MVLSKEYYIEVSELNMTLSDFDYSYQHQLYLCQPIYFNKLFVEKIISWNDHGVLASLRSRCLKGGGREGGNRDEKKVGKKGRGELGERGSSFLPSPPSSHQRVLFSSLFHKPSPPLYAPAMHAMFFQNTQPTARPFQKKEKSYNSVGNRRNRQMCSSRQYPYSSM